MASAGFADGTVGGGIVWPACGSLDGGVTTGSAGIAWPACGSAGAGADADFGAGAGFVAGAGIGMAWPECCAIAGLASSATPSTAAEANKRTITRRPSDP